MAAAELAEFLDSSLVFAGLSVTRMQPAFAEFVLVTFAANGDTETSFI